MIIFPAIDIRGGKCVRLEEGRFDRETVFAENPLDAARRWVEAGINRVILGSVAARSPELVEQLCSRYGEKIVIGIDARDGEVAVDGWEKSGLLRVEELTLRMKQVGAKRIIYTDISRDGMLTGVNVESTLQLAQQSGLAVIASGGVKGMEDILVLQPLAVKGIEGVIIGKALYTGAIDLTDALQVARGGAA